MTYSFSIWSYYPITIKVIKHTLESLMIQNYIFPAEIYFEGEKILINSPIEYTHTLYEKMILPMDPDRVSLILKSIQDPVRLSFFGEAYEMKQKVIPNTITVSFDIEFMKKNNFSTNNFINLLDMINPVFNVEQASLMKPDAQEKTQYAELPNGLNFRAHIDWITFLNAELVDYCGQQKFESIKNDVELIKDFHGGKLIVLQDEPFDPNNEKHISRKIKVEKKIFSR